MPVLMPEAQWQGRPIAPMVEALSPATVKVGGVTFGSRDSDDVYWAFETIEGWYESPQMRVASQPRPNAHGDFSARGWHASRVVTLTGWVATPSRALSAQAVTRLGSLLSDGQNDDLTVVDADMGTLTARAQMAPTEPVIRWDHEQFITYMLEFLCPDPHRYGTPVTVSTGLPSQSGGLEFPLFADGFLDFGAAGTSGRVTASNPGTAEAHSLFTVSGTLPGGFELIEVGGGRRLRYEGPITAAGDPLTLDSATGRVRLGTADRGGSLTRAEWWPVPAGGSVEVLFTSLGGYSADASLSVTTTPTFW